MTDARAQRFADEEAEAMRRRFLAPSKPKPVIAYLLPVPPRFALRCAESDCYLGASLDEAGRNRNLRDNPHYRVVKVEG